MPVFLPKSFVIAIAVCSLIGCANNDATNEIEAAKKDAEIAKKEADLAKKEAELAKKETALAQAETESLKSKMNSRDAGSETPPSDNIDQSTPVAAFKSLSRVLDTDTPDMQRVRSLCTERINKVLDNPDQLHDFLKGMRIEFAVADAVYGNRDDYEVIRALMSPGDQREFPTAEALREEILKAREPGHPMHRRYAQPQYTVDYGDDRTTATVDRARFRLIEGKWYWDER